MKTSKKKIHIIHNGKACCGITRKGSSGYNSIDVFEAAKFVTRDMWCLKCKDLFNSNITSWRKLK